MSRLDHTATRSSTHRRGNAIMELVVVLPFLLAVLFGIIEFGSVMYTRHTMIQAAREAARAVAIQNGSVSEATAVATSRLGGMSGINFSVNITAPGSIDDANQDVTVEITAPLSEAALADPIGIMGDGVLRVKSVMRKEN